MAHSRSDSSGKAPRPQPLNGIQPPPVPADTSSEDGVENILDDPLEGGPPTDDTPTIISRNPPRPPEEVVSGIRGRRLAHFELIEPIGVGGMAAVLRARDTQLDRLVALKILPPETASDPENVRRFHQEARSAARLDHENIARVFFCGEDQRLHFIAFEFVEGENLRNIIERRGRLPVGEALHYMLQVATGLAHASRRGVVHRDIKPSNIIITPHGRAKLVDMGLARTLGPQSDNGLTQSGVTLGTFDYISPEQALEPREADVRSDIYSLGCTFYHCLTGRPPVPEGTAAKKLHHHQHVKPADPRQLVHGLPDEVAVILDRMMAKNPNERYQSPEDLVQALLAATRSLGSPAPASDGVMTVEAVLPVESTRRPLLLAGLAAVVVVVLVLALDRLSVRGPNPGPGWSGAGDAREKAAVPGNIGSGQPVVAEKQPPTPREGSGQNVAVYTPPEEPTVKHLAEWLQQNQDAAELRILLPPDLDLSARRDRASEPGLVIQARQKVTIRSSRPRQLSTLRFAYDGHAVSGRRVALLVRAREVVVEDVRLIVDAKESPGTEMVGLLIQGGQSEKDGEPHRVERCEFVQARPSFKDESKRVASLVIEPDRGPARLNVQECCFLGFGRLENREGLPDELHFRDVVSGGQDAIVRKGSVRLEVANCVFGPHLAMFRLERGGEGAARQVFVRNCSILAGRRSAVFEVPEDGAAEVEMGQSVVARLGGGAARERDRTVLIQQADPQVAFKFEGNDNRYYDLDGYWCVGTDWQKASWKAFRTRFLEGGVQLQRAPWALDRDKQTRALEQGQADKAFRLNASWVAVRERGLASLNLLGSQRVLGNPCVPESLPMVQDNLDKTGGRLLVVELDSNDSTNGIYPSLPQAILAALPGDTICIRHNGVLPVSPIRLDKGHLADLTIRPWRRFRPILTLGATTEKETGLFRVHAGRLRLEKLEFLLEPSEEQSRLQVVNLAGDGECSFEGCAITLGRGATGSSEASLAVALLDLPGREMKMKTEFPGRSADQGPLLSLEGCFVRGEGDLLWNRASRPCELTVSNSLVALKGSLLNLEVPPDAPAPPAAQKVQLNLRNVTTWLGNSLIHLAPGREGKGLVPVACAPVECLFLPALASRPFIQVEVSEISKKALEEKLRWSGVKNAYGGFKSMVEHQPTGEEMMRQLPVSLEAWRASASVREEESLFEVKQPKAADAAGPFTQVEASWFAQPEEYLGRGANVTGLPRPTRP
jgi:hypothetical protein